MIKAIIFDCFGVLVGSGFKETYRQAGGDPHADTEFLADLLGSASLGLITSQQMSQKIVDKLGVSYEDWRHVVARSEQPNQALLDYITGLKKQYKTAILSNANIGTLQRKFTPDQLALFDAVVVSAEVGMIKPDPRIYEYTAQQLDAHTEECIFIDDNENYCQAAAETGMIAVFYHDFDQLTSEITSLLANNS